MELTTAATEKNYNVCRQILDGMDDSVIVDVGSTPETTRV